MTQNYISLKCCQVTNFNFAQKSANRRSGTTHTGISRKWVMYLVLNFLLFSTLVGYAQTIIIGAGTATQRYPLGNYFGYERSASLYTSAEVGTTGLITKLAWYATNAGDSRPIKIYLKSTNSTTLTASMWASRISGATLVFDSSKAITATSWNEFILSSSFAYAGGTDNLLVLVEANYGGDGIGTSAGSSVRYTTATTQHAYYQSDASIPTGNGTITNNRPNIQISFTPTVAPICAVFHSPVDLATNVVRNLTLSWQNSGAATSYDVYFGTTTNPPLVANVISTTYTPAILNANTNYYWKIVPKNSLGIAVGCVERSFTTGANLSYCTPSSTDNSTFINNFTTTGGSTDISNTTGYNPGGYQDNFAGPAVTVLPSNSFNFSITLTGGTVGAAIWVDWNNNGVFDTSERVYYTTSYGNGPFTGTINVPGSTAVGNYRMRVMVDYWSAEPNNPCSFSNTGPRGETEDYKIIVGTPPPCTTPTTQPTALSLTVSNAVISGTFTAANPAANSYLVVASTNSTPPNPVNGTAYPIGSTVGAGYTVIDTDSNTTFSANALNSSTTYYFFIFSFNNFCSGGPLYLATTPLTGTATTGSCVPLVSAGFANSLYTSSVKILGSLREYTKVSTFSSTPLGYQNWTLEPNSAIEVQGNPLNILIKNSQNSSVIAWVDWNNDGNFLDTAEKVYSSNNVLLEGTTFGFIVPINQTPGNYKIRIRSNSPTGTYPYTACEILENQAGETEDHSFTVVAKCNSLITSVANGTSCTVNSTVVLGATATSGVTQFKWYNVPNGGTPLSTTAAVGNSGTYTTNALAVTTNFYVTAFNGSCESQTRTLVVANINKTPLITIAPTSLALCGENSVVQITASSADKELAYLLNEDFESGGLGSFSASIAGSNPVAINAIGVWQNKSSAAFPATTSWMPAISSGLNGNKFAMATSNLAATVETTLTSGSMSTVEYGQVFLKFDIYYSRYYPDNTNDTRDYVRVELSTNGGSTWITAPDLDVNKFLFTKDIGTATKFATVDADLSVFTNQADLKIRFRYYGESAQGVAIDNVQLFGPKSISSFKFNTTTANAFTDNAATIPYISGSPATSIYVKPSLSQLESAIITIPVTTGFNLCGKDALITNNTKIFSSATAQTEWNNASNWKPVGIPTASNCIIIGNNVEVTGVDFSALGFNLSIKNSGLLTVNSDNNLLITEAVKIEASGQLRLKNNGSLLQINDVANTGSGQMKMERTANIKKLDYVYWSSPLTTASAFASSAISVDSPISSIYKWLPTITGNLNGFGNWVSGVENMVSGKGYIVRGPNSYTNTVTPFTATFSGVPANGTIAIPIQRGSWNAGNYATGVSATPGTNEDDNWNLVGNPYPSAISAVDFLSANNTIDGFINIWTHGTLPSNTIASPFYQTFVYNYSSADYITYNGTGSSTGPNTYNGIIPAAQSFFVSMLHSSPTPSNLTFTNAMRRSNYNSTFYRSITQIENLGEGRIWLDLVAENGSNIRTLVGYIDGATNSQDRLFDASTNDKESLNIFSNGTSEMFKIQGRQVPFNPEDRVSVGVTVPQDGFYTIAIGAVDGLFSTQSQNIFLEDKNTAIIHDLRESPYRFSASNGKDIERFVLRYTNGTLGNDNFGDASAKVIIASSADLQVKSSISEIKSVKVFDVLGRELAFYSNINSYNLTLTNFRKLNSTLIIQVTLANDTIVNKKIIY